MGEAQQGSSCRRFQLEDEAGSAPFGAGFAQPLAARRRFVEPGFQPVQRRAFEESELDAAVAFLHIRSPLLRPALCRGSQRKNLCGRSRNLDGMPNVSHKTKVILLELEIPGNCLIANGRPERTKVCIS